MKGKIKKVRIIFKDIKLKIDCIKMDIKYEHGEGNYSSAQLRKMCRRYDLDFDEFLKNISSRTNRYQYLKKALKENLALLFTKITVSVRRFSPIIVKATQGSSISLYSIKSRDVEVEEKIIFNLSVTSLSNSSIISSII